MPDPTPVLYPTRSAVSRAARMVGERELGLVADAVLDIAPDWSVELCGTDVSDCCLAVIPEGADDMLGPTFLIRATPDCVRLEQLRFDELRPLAEGEDLAVILPILRGQLASLSLPSAPGLRLKH